jgi:hypothetical protein
LKHVTAAFSGIIVRFGFEFPLAEYSPCSECHPFMSAHGNGFSFDIPIGYVPLALVNRKWGECVVTRV